MAAEAGVKLKEFDFAVEVGSSKTLGTGALPNENEAA